MPAGLLAVRLRDSSFDATIIVECGPVAQLGERVNGIHEVVGSTPIGSTKLDKAENLRVEVPVGSIGRLLS